MRWQPEEAMSGGSMLLKACAVLMVLLVASPATAPFQTHVDGSASGSRAIPTDHDPDTQIGLLVEAGVRYLTDAQVSLAATQSVSLAVAFGPVNHGRRDAPTAPAGWSVLRV
jgi:hypothetical protein